MSKTSYVSINEFAKTIVDLQLSDREVNLAVAGMTGEGKSTFLIQLFKAHNKILFKDNNFSLKDRITWERSELIKWIDGDTEKEKDPVTNLRPGQLPEYSGIIADEFFRMFYKRTWYEGEQIEAISIFNMARDRHLFIGGAVPLLWDLDSAFLSRIRFYVYIYERGRAWVFQQENNPFIKDPWNIEVNRKIFKKTNSPIDCPNFIGEIWFNDLTELEKTEYLELRNTKRLKAVEKESKLVKNSRYYNTIKQRDKLLIYLKEHIDNLTDSNISEICGLSPEAVALIIHKGNNLP